MQRVLMFSLLRSIRLQDELSLHQSGMKLLRVLQRQPAGWFPAATHAVLYLVQRLCDHVTDHAVVAG